MGMEFSIEKSTMLTRKSGKRERMEAVELPNQESIRMFREKEISRTWKYLEILEVDNIKQTNMKEKYKKRVHQKKKKTISQKLALQ